MFQKSLLIVLFSSCISCLTFAQKYSLNASAEKFEDYLNEQYYLPATGQYLLVNFASPHGSYNPKRDFDKTTVIGFDKMLKKTFSLDVPELSKQVFITGKLMNNKLLFFYADQNNVVYKAEMNPLNGVVSGSEKAVELNRNILDGLKTSVRGLRTTSSLDQSKFMIALENREKKDDNQTYEILVYDNAVKKVGKYTIRQGAESDKVVRTGFLLGNDGRVYIVSTILKDKKSISPLEYLIQVAGSEGTSSSTISGLPEGLVNHLKWMIQKNTLSFVGLLAKVKKGNFTHLISGDFEMNEKKLSGLKEQAFVEVYGVSSATDYYTKKLKGEGLPSESTLDNYIVNPDKSAYIIFEDNNSKAFGNDISAGGFLQSSSVSGNDYFAANLYVVKLTPKNDIAWVNVIAKNQGQMADNENINAVSITDKQGGLHILFNDDNDRIDAQPSAKISKTYFNGKLKGVSLFSTYISADGKKVSKSVVQNYEKEEFYFAPHRVTVLENEHRIFYTPFRLRNSGNSEFKLGTIEIN